MKEITDRTGISPSDVKTIGIRPFNNFALPGGTLLGSGKTDSVFLSNLGKWGIPDEQRKYVDSLVAEARKEYSEDTVTQFRTRLIQNKLSERYEPGDIAILKKMFGGGSIRI